MEGCAALGRPVFSTFLQGTVSDAYERKRVYRPAAYLNSSNRTIILQHDDNGPKLPVECYDFEPDPDQPDQTKIFWKEEGGWRSESTPPASLSSLEHDLEPYVESSVHLALDKACKGPHHIAKLFQLARVFNYIPIIHLSLKMYTAVELLKSGWFICGEETLGTPVLRAVKSPWHGKKPAPGTVQRQLDHMLEVLLASWETSFCKSWQTIMQKQGKMGWIQMFLASFIIMHIMEQDAQRLKIHCEQSTAINNWKHPLSPTTLVEKTIHFCNTFLVHFRGISGGMNPLRLDWLPENTQSLAKGNQKMVDAIKDIKEHKSYLETCRLINRKPCDTYKPGDEESCNFTWSSCLFDDNINVIRMEDFLGKKN